jgi:hypothetical protein
LKVHSVENIKTAKAFLWMWYKIVHKPLTDSSMGSSYIQKDRRNGCTFHTATDRRQHELFIWLLKESITMFRLKDATYRRIEHTTLWSKHRGHSPRGKATWKDKLHTWSTAPELGHHWEITRGQSYTCILQNPVGGRHSGANLGGKCWAWTSQSSNNPLSSSCGNGLAVEGITHSFAYFLVVKGPSCSNPKCGKATSDQAQGKVMNFELKER